LGEPQFIGLRGQSFQIHGVDGQVYNIIVDAGMRVNARFVYLSDGRCPTVPSPANCWSHPGSYLGEFGVWTAASDRLVITSGDYNVGFAAVMLNEQRLQPAASTVHGLSLQLTFASAFSLRVTVGNFELTLKASDRFINLVGVRVLDWGRLRLAHGLLGQTWGTHAPREYEVAAIEGWIDDYAVSDNELLGDGFVFQAKQS
jgi:hypothetical protein